MRKRPILKPYGAIKDCAEACGVSVTTVKSIIKSGFTRGRADTIYALRIYIDEAGYTINQKTNQK